MGWSAEATWRHLFDTLYFHNPFWIAAHNALHSPTVLIICLVVLWRFQGLTEAPRRWLLWFFAACLLHSFVDVLTHVDDGPLLFFPFEWTIRFESPVSYWDSRHYGAQFAVFELTLDAFLLAYLCLPPLWRLARARLLRGAAGRIDGRIADAFRWSFRRRPESSPDQVGRPRQSICQ